MDEPSVILRNDHDRVTPSPSIYLEPVTMHATLRRLASLAALLTLTGGALSFTAAPLLASGDVTIEMSLLGFTPSDLEVETGTTITWVNTERLNYPVLGGAHRVNAADGSFESGDIPPGAAFTTTFNNPVAISYVCEFHPHTMSGTLTVIGDPVVPPATEKTISIVEGNPNDTASWKFKPNELAVEVGTTVIWRNLGSIDHTVTDGDGTFDSGFLRGGQSFTRTFTKPVAISYFCKPHPWMTGTIVVSAPGQAPPKLPTKKPTATGGGVPTTTVVPPTREGNEPATWQAKIVEGSVSDPQSWGYAPDSLSVQEGDTVVWTNAGSIAHTVTADGGLLDSGDLDAGLAFSFTFPSTGTFTYACKPHPWMTGVIQVVPAGVDVSTVAPVSAPEPVVGAPGGSAEPGSSTDTDISRSQATAAWTVGSMAVAAGTGIGIFAIGGVIALLGALQLRRQRGDVKTDDLASASMIEAASDAEPAGGPVGIVIDLSETPVLVAANAAPRKSAIRADAD